MLLSAMLKAVIASRGKTMPEKGYDVYPRWWLRIIANIRNRFRTFKYIELERYSDEWLANEFKRVNPRGTICESHRKLHKNIAKMKDSEMKREMTQDLKRAYIFGQKMANRLKKYKDDINEEGMNDG